MEPREPHRKLLIAALSLVALGGIGAAAYRPLLSAWIRREAAQRGFELDFDAVELDSAAVHLRGARVTLVGVRGVRADLEDIRVTLDGLSPQSINASGVVVAVEGSAADRLLELSAWSTDHPDLYRIPGTGTGIQLTWAPGSGEAAWLTLGGGTLLSRGSGATFQAASATFESIPVGVLGAAWSAEAAVISIGLGKEVVAEAPIRVDLQPRARPPTALVTLRPFKLEELGAPLGIGLPAPGAVVEGSATLSLGERAGRDAIEGSVAIAIKGWLPPHPRQLDSIVFGNTTAFAAKLSVSEDRRKVELSDATVTAGALKLKGKGAIERDPSHAVTRLDLNGAIACADVARSATTSDWGEALGQLVGGIARQTMEGSVAVRVHVEADTKDLRAAKVQHEIGVGCGLRLPKVF